MEREREDEIVVFFSYRKRSETIHKMELRNNTEKNVLYRSIDAQHARAVATTRSPFIILWKM